MADQRRDCCVFVANGDAEAEQVRSFLESAGIISAVRGEAVRKAFAVTLDGLGSVEVLVAADDEQRARELLAAAEAGEFQLPPDTDA